MHGLGDLRRGATIDDRRQPNGIVTAKLAKRRDVNRRYREKE